MIGVASVFLVLLQAATPARPGVVTGQLQTREGLPAAAIRISALPAPPPNILPSDGQNYYSTTAPAGTTLSDAQGRFRLANLAPGRYFIVASVFGYPTFYPSGTNADRATVITVGADKPSEGVNFSVELPPGGRVSGRLDSPAAPGVQEKAVLSGVALGDTIYLRDGEWVDGLLGSSDRPSYVESLRLIGELDFDVLVPWPATGGGPYFSMTSPADTKRRIAALLDRIA